MSSTGPQDDVLRALFARRTFGIRPGLDAVDGIWGAMGCPTAGLPAVHVVGTNGKGSVSAMIAHALASRGHRTGLFTSPHLRRVTERVRVRGVEVDARDLAAAVDRVLQHEGQGGAPRGLSFFEVLTLAALDVFERSDLDVIVMEAGLGGRLDATRLVSASAMVVTSIAMDHEKWLGDSLAAIAGEKAGVFVRDVPVFTCEQPPEAMVVLRERADRVGAPLHVCAPLPDAPLLGAHQRVNAALALTAARAIDPTVQRADLDGVSWPGRLERRGELVLDVAHNPAAVEAIVAELRTWPARPTVVLFACSADKDRASMTASLRTLGEVWTLADPKAELVPADGAARCFDTLADPALRPAVDQHLANGGRVLACGSHRLVGALDGHPVDPSDPR